MTAIVSQLLFRLYVIWMLFVLHGYLSAVHHNSMEAHKHTHELACALNYEALCVFHEAQP